MPDKTKALIAIDALDDFIEAANDLSDAWDEVLNAEDDFPFRESFDDWIPKLIRWREAAAVRLSKGDL